MDKFTQLYYKFLKDLILIIIISYFFGGAASSTVFSHRHKYDEYVDCTEVKGYEDKEGHFRKCSVCGEIDTSEIIFHSYTIKNRDNPDDVKCGEDIYGDYICKLCNHTKHDKVAVKGHSQTKKFIISKEPTLTNTGILEHRCKDCNELLAEQSIPILTNTNAWKKEIKEATCSEDGYIKYKVNFKNSNPCEPGTEIIYEHFEKLPHEMVHIDKQDVTCISDGYNEHDECKNCGYSENKIIYKSLGHKLISETHKFNENDYLSTTFKCECGETFYLSVRPSKITLDLPTSSHKGSCTKTYDFSEIGEIYENMHNTIIDMQNSTVQLLYIFKKEYPILSEDNVATFDLSNPYNIYAVVKDKQGNVLATINKDEIDLIVINKSVSIEHRTYQYYYAIFVYNDRTYYELYKTTYSLN